uniref:Uncharacterized protein n=1 Tax=Echinococcus granulosus TaxID=6210 RepID=A0A068WMY8_ECHGR|nr:hypothetical protein EgrG_000555300 [Echinococcus granulosus]
MREKKRKRKKKWKEKKKEEQEAEGEEVEEKEHETRVTCPHISAIPSRIISDQVVYPSPAVSIHQQSVRIRPTTSRK